MERMTDEQHQRFNDYLRLAREGCGKAVRRLEPRFHDGLYSAALHGLLAAALGWNPAGGLAFHNYARRRIFRAIGEHTREVIYGRPRADRCTLRWGRAVKILGPDAFEVRERKGGLTFLREEADHTEELADRDEAEWLLARLPERTARLLSESCFGGRTLTEIARERGVSKQALDHQIDTDLRRFRRRLALDAKGGDDARAVA